MKRRYVALLVLVAVVCFGIALSYPIRYWMEERSAEDSLDRLLAMRDAGLAGQESAGARNESEGEVKAVREATEDAADRSEDVKDRSEGRGAEEAVPRAQSTRSAGEAALSLSPGETMPEPEAQGEPGATPEPEAQGEPGATPEPEAQGEGEAGTKPEAHGEGEAGTKPGAHGEGEAAAEPGVQGEGEAGTKPEAQGEGEVEVEPEAQTAPEAVAAPGALTPREVPGEPGATAEAGDRATEAGESSAPTPAVTPAPTPTPVPTPTPNRFERDGAVPYDEKTRRVLDYNAILPQYREIYAENHDFVGWITIPGTVVDYPVVQTEQNDYYLRRDFFGNKNANGTIILDSKCDPYTPSYNLVISGHSMRSGKMFGRLVNYMYESYWKKHKLVYFDTLMEQKTYVVMAAFFSADYDVDEEGFRYNADIRYSLDARQWLREVKESELYDTGIDAEFGDEFLTLTTCNNAHRKDGRFVVICRRLREGERIE